MPVINSRYLRIAILFLSAFALGDYILSRHLRVNDASVSGFRGSHEPSWALSSSPRLTWNEGLVPETVVALHKIPGWTVFRNLYILNGTIYIVTREPEVVPATKFMISNGLPLEFEEDNKPTERTLSIINPEEAKALFGQSASLLDGLSFIQSDPPQFLHHMYHLVVEIFALGHWRTWTSPDLDHLFGGDWRPFPRRFIFPHTLREEWQDRAGMNMWTMRAGIGGMALEFQNDWDYRMSLGKPFCLQYVVLGDRAAWHRGPFWKWPTTNFPLIVQDGWWEPIRQSVVAFAAPSTREETTATPVITYISRQKTGRRLRAQDHDNLVEALENLGREHGYEIQIPLMEDMAREDQVVLLSRTTILLGVHGNGLSGQMWLKPSPRTTVIEIFFPNGFAYDYEYTARSLGHKHYGFWNEKYFTAPDLPPINSPKGFHETNIPCNANAIVALIHRRLSLKDPSQA